MPNVNLLPGPSPLSLAQLIAGTEDAILIKGRAATASITNANFNLAARPAGRSRAAHHRHAQGRGLSIQHPEFWAACDAICSREEYYVAGRSSMARRASQANAVSHGCCPRASARSTS
jgi:hypothetical protein